MSQYDYSKKKRVSRTFRRIRGILLILLVLALLVWGGSKLVKKIQERPSDIGTDIHEVTPGTLPGGTDEPKDDPQPPAGDPEPTDPIQLVPIPTDPTGTEPTDPAGNGSLSNPGSEDWRTILVSAAYPLAEEMEMERTTVVGAQGTVGQQVDRRIAESLKAFLDAGEAAGYPLQIISGYRTFERSRYLLEREINARKNMGLSQEEAERVAAMWVAPPGTSEHNTGLAADIISLDYYMTHGDLEESFEYDAPAIWMSEHCAEYGFILRYPKGKTDVTGIGFEPWHFRYVGVENATYIMANGLTLEEFLGAA